MKKAILTLFAIIGLAGCNLQHIAYDRPFTQGNVFSKEDMAKLSLGMSEEEVRNIMGNPVLTNVISKHEWDYVYYEHKDRHTRHLKTVLLRFEDGKLSSISPR